MGNRATVIFWNGYREGDEHEPRFSPAVYLHWNGGPESVYGFLEELDRREVRSDQCYECARFVQLVGEFFTWNTQRDLSDPIYRESAFGLSLGVVNGPESDSPADLAKVQTDHSDNGFYLVSRSPDGLYVRRFTESGPDWTLSEWSREFVDREREEADESDYRPQFREFYAALDERAPRPQEVPA